MFQTKVHEHFGGTVLTRELLLVLLIGGMSATALEAEAQFGRTAIDNFGHRGAPIPYNFRDISVTGTPLNLGDDASLYTWLSPFDDFSFDYFGTPFKWVYVASNGFLSFSSDVAPYQAQQLPGSGVENMIAAAWTDLDPAQGGEIYVQTLGSPGSRELVVMFDNIRHQLDLYDLDPTPSRFEIILHEGSNDIEFQYETLWQNKIIEGAQTNAISIGIQNYARDDGLQIALLPFDLMGGSDAVVASNQGYLISTNPIPPDAWYTHLDQGWYLGGYGVQWPQGTENVVGWTRFSVPEAVNEVEHRVLVIDTIGSDLNNGDDTEIALYDAAGNLVALNDDAVPSLPGGTYLSRLAFGDADGPLPAGDYYLATSAFESDAILGGENFDWVSTSPAWGSIDINYFYGTDAGTLENGTTTTAQQYLDVGDVQWYRFDLPQDIVAEDGESLVIDTFDTVALDTEIGLYDSNGDLVAASDDYGGISSRLGIGAVADADKSELLAGTYYLAAGGYDTIFYGADFDATGGSAAGYMVLNFTAAIVPSILFGDYNDDGIVDAADYTVWRNNLGASIALPNEDPDQTQGRVTAEDYTVWRLHYGETTPGGGTILRQVFDVDRSIPEPATILTLLAGGLTLSCFFGRAAFGTGRQ